MRPTARCRLKLALRAVLAAASATVSRAFSSPACALRMRQSRNRVITAVNPKSRWTIATERRHRHHRELPWSTAPVVIACDPTRRRFTTSRPAFTGNGDSSSERKGSWPHGLARPKSRGAAVGVVCRTAEKGEGVATREVGGRDGGDDGLNDSQREAVWAEVGPVRVVAGPGSGKTRVLTYRIAHLVRHVGAPPWSILAVTFTRKASNEMRTRVTQALSEEHASKIALGTFHSICARMLRWHGDALPSLIPGLDKNFSVFDSDDSRRLLTDIIKEGGRDPTEVKPAAILSQISKRKSAGLGPGESVDTSGARGARKTTHERMLADLYSKYQSRLVQSNALDFDDIILVALKMLQQNQDVFRAVGRRYRHVLVDEWQDTNGPQYDLVLELVRAGREAQYAREDAARSEGVTGEESYPPPSIFVVGDTDQCIYRFRGADYTNVARFEKDFEGCHTVFLRENYRSTATIARAANAVIERVEERVKQPTVAVQGDGLPIGVMQCSDAAGEAAAVAHQVELYWTSKRVPASEMAVMYRTNAQSRSFEEAFLRKGLPFVVVGAQRFYERREIKDCLVYLRLAANPCDNVAMRRAINTPPRGIGEKTVDALRTMLASARAIPGLELITGPECLMALLDAEELDALEAALAGMTASNDAGNVLSDENGGAVGGDAPEWAQDDEDERTAVAAGEAAVGGGEAAEGWRGFSVQRARRLGEAMGAGEIEPPTRRQVNALKVFASLMGRLRVVASTEGLLELMKAVLVETNMEKYVTETLSATGPAEGADRWQNVLELVRAASNPKFTGIAGAGALEAFLTDVALMGGDAEEEKKRREEMEAAAAEAGGDGAAATAIPDKPEMIQLMTVHASKGLEFDTVFLTGLEDGTFPSARSADGDELDEERRLMYVGMTRAKARLFLSWREERLVFTGAGSRRQESERSMFLDDIPRELVRSIDKTTAGASTGSRNSAYRGGVGGSGARSNTGSGSGRKTRGQRNGDRGGAAAQQIVYYSGNAGGVAGRGKTVKEEDSLDFTTEFFRDVGSGGAAASRSMQRGRGNGSRGMPRGTHGYSGGNFEGPTRGSHGIGYSGGGGGVSGSGRESVRTRGGSGESQHRYRTNPVVRDAGMRRSTGMETDIDISWASKLTEAPTSALGVQVGAQVKHAVHGPGKVVALVEGADAVNVEFSFDGQPFVTRVVGSKLEVL